MLKMRTAPTGLREISGDAGQDGLRWLELAGLGGLFPAMSGH